MTFTSSQGLNNLRRQYPLSFSCAITWRSEEWGKERKKRYMIKRLPLLLHPFHFFSVFIPHPGYQVDSHYNGCIARLPLVVATDCARVASVFERHRNPFSRMWSPLKTQRFREGWAKFTVTQAPLLGGLWLVGSSLRPTLLEQEWQRPAIVAE